MSRLYGVKVDDNRWKIVEVDNDNYHTYKLIDKEKEEIYFLNHIIGIEQVEDEEFLIFRRATYDDFEIVRYKLQESKFERLFSKKFSHFHFIDDDRIMFTYWGNTGPYRFQGVYSIKDNKMLDDAKWLDGAGVEVYKDDHSDDVKLYVEEEIHSYELDNPKLLFTVDPRSLQPNSLCYSELRDSFIKVNSREDIENIKSEDQRNIRVIEEYMFQEKHEQLKRAKEKVLVRKN